MVFECRSRQKLFIYYLLSYIFKWENSCFRILDRIFPRNFVAQKFVYWALSCRSDVSVLYNTCTFTTASAFTLKWSYLRPIANKTKQYLRKLLTEVHSPKVFICKLLPPIGLQYYWFILEQLVNKNTGNPTCSLLGSEPIGNVVVIRPIWLVIIWREVKP